MEVSQIHLLNFGWFVWCEVENAFCLSALVWLRRSQELKSYQAGDHDVLQVRCLDGCQSMYIGFVEYDPSIFFPFVKPAETLEIHRIFLDSVESTLILNYIVYIVSFISMLWYTYFHSLLIWVDHIRFLTNWEMSNCMRRRMRNIGNSWRTPLFRELDRSLRGMFSGILTTFDGYFAASSSQKPCQAN